jgi:hypothetical protein
MPFAGMIENQEQYAANAKKRRESGEHGTFTTYKSKRAVEAARFGRTVQQANEERAALVEQHGKTLVVALKKEGIKRNEVPDEIWRDAIARMIDQGREPLDAIDAASLNAEHDAVVAESDESEAAAERKEAVSEPQGKEAHGRSTQLSRPSQEKPGEANALHEGGKAGAKAGEVGGEPERAGPAAGANAGERQPATERGAEGKPQLVIPGTERISDAELAKRKAAEALKPKVAQKPADEGLFGDESKQTDLVDQARHRTHHTDNRRHFRSSTLPHSIRSRR